MTSNTMYNFQTYNFSNTTNFTYGDVDYDGTITHSDAQIVMNVALKINNDVSNLQKILSDYNKDGVVDMEGAQAVLNKALKIK